MPGPRWLAALLWALLIFGLSSIPSLGTGLGAWDEVLRTGAHFAEYAVLGGLLAWWLRRPAVAVAAGSAYAVTDELHQALVPGRAASVVDWAVDTLGVLAGVLLARRLAHR
jgi:VanZ family protein